MSITSCAPEYLLATKLSWCMCLSGGCLNAWCGPYILCDSEDVLTTEQLVFHKSLDSDEEHADGTRSDDFPKTSVSAIMDEQECQQECQRQQAALSDALNANPGTGPRRRR